MYTDSSITPKSKGNPSELFTDFFAFGLDETISPFIQATSQKWGVNLYLKASIAAAILLVVSFICSFFMHLEPISHFLLVIVYFLAGIPSLIEAIEDLFDGQINIDILMTLAAFLSVLIGSSMEGGLLLVLFALSGAMEDAVTAKAKNTLSSLNKLSPTKACIVLPDGMIIQKMITEIDVGATLLIKAGEVVPLDGKVIKGTSSVNLVHLTGENFPITKTIGDTVAAGAMNLEGALTIEVTRTSSDSTLAKIIDLVVQAQNSRPRLQRWFDSVSRTYAISIICLAAFFSLSLPLILGIPFVGVEGSFYRSIAFLIAASPCALIIAIPIAYLSALSVCASRGILLKGGVTLDALARCKTIAFDKTGTLTTGELTCTEIEPLNGQETYSIEQAITCAYALEKNAVHPIAAAIIKYAEQQKKNKIEHYPTEHFKSIPGYGIEASVKIAGQYRSAYMGKASYVIEKLPQSLQNKLNERALSIEKEGELLSLLVIGTSAFIFHFRDTPREHISDMLASLKKRGLKTVMLTGDHTNSAAKIAEELGIDRFYAELNPEQKLKFVVELSGKHDLAMIGDGVNDAPSLARATVGICMGKIGSATAASAADIVLLHDNIELLDWLIGKSKATVQVVRQNLSIAALAIIIASLPALGGVIPLWLAVVMHEGGTVLVGLNALRLLRT